jgi:LysR family transcriptional regulator, transcriptional activator for dmlA
MNALEGRISGGSKQPQGTVRIAATLGFGRTHLAPMLSKFVEKYPQIDVQLHLSDRLVNMVDQGFDVMVKFGDQSDSRLTARLLATNGRILCAAPAYLADKGVPLHPRDLGKHNCIFIREADETYGTWHLRSGSDHELVKVRSNLSTNDGSSALGWALDGRGILYRSQWEIAPFIRSKELIPVLPEWRHPSADIHLIFQATKQTPAKIRALVDWLLEEFKLHRRQTKDLCGAW